MEQQQFQILVANDSHFQFAEIICTKWQNLPKPGEQASLSEHRNTSVKKLTKESRYRTFFNR
jgi:hypothetical protein